MAEIRSDATGEVRELRDLPTPDATTVRRLLGLLHGQMASETQHNSSTSSDGRAQSA